MHVALVSTYPPTKCGIANYAKNLVTALREEGITVTVLAESSQDDTAEVGTRHCWNRKGNWVADLVEQLAQLQPDVVHFQHEEAILGQDARLSTLLRSVRELGIATLVTLHSVYSGVLGVPGIRFSGRQFQRFIGEHADLIIVHQIDGCEDLLLNQGVAGEKVLVIPHGTSMLTLKDKSDARVELGLSEHTPLILAIGFIHKKKGLHTLVHALPRVLQHIPKVQLLIAGSFRERPWDILYNRRLRRDIAPAIANQSIDLREDFHSAASMNTMLAAADLLALPYQQKYGSASGILHMALGAGAPVLCANGYKFAEAKRAWGQAHPTFFPEPEVPSAWATALTHILGNREILEQLAKESRALGEATSWERVAKSHIQGFELARIGATTKPQQ